MTNPNIAHHLSMFVKSEKVSISIAILSKYLTEFGEILVNGSDVINGWRRSRLL